MEIVLNEIPVPALIILPFFIGWLITLTWAYVRKGEDGGHHDAATMMMAVRPPAKNNARKAVAGACTTNARASDHVRLFEPIKMHSPCIFARAAKVAGPPGTIRTIDDDAPDGAGDIEQQARRNKHLQNNFFSSLLEEEGDSPRAAASSCPSPPPASILYKLQQHQYVERLADIYAQATRWRTDGDAHDVLVV